MFSRESGNAFFPLLIDQIGRRLFVEIGRPLMNRKSYLSLTNILPSIRSLSKSIVYNFKIRYLESLKNIFWFVRESMERNRRDPPLKGGEPGWNVLSARWLYYKLNRSAQLRGWCTKGIGVTTPRSIIRNDGAFPTIHGYLVFTGYKRTYEHVCPYMTHVPQTIHLQARLLHAVPDGKGQGRWVLQKKLNDTRPCLRALLTTRCTPRMHSINFSIECFVKIVSYACTRRWRYF